MKKSVIHRFKCDVCNMFYRDITEHKDKKCLGCIIRFRNKPYSDIQKKHIKRKVKRDKPIKALKSMRWIIDKEGHIQQVETFKSRKELEKHLYIIKKKWEELNRGVKL